MHGLIFNWLPPMAIINVLLFGVSISLLFGLERKGGTGRFNIWMLGISFWLVGMVFDALGAVNGWDILQVVEHLFQLGGSMIITYAAYVTNKRLKGVTGVPVSKDNGEA